MVFSHLEFLFGFFPAFFILYFFVPPSYKNGFLFFGSMLFYVLGTLEHPLHFFLLLFSIAVNYFLGIAMTQFPIHKKRLLATGLAYNFFWLFLFKYCDFLFSGINLFLKNLLPSFGLHLPMLELVLPIGISFYTFQVVSYLIDVYRGTCTAETSFLRLGTYISMFPQLIAGPIVTYPTVQHQLQKRPCRLTYFSSGCKTFVIGLGYKVLLANYIGNLWNDICAIGFESISTPLAWMGILAFSFQIYFDFYGYSLMAVGLGRMMGFRLPQNFHYPYLTRSMTDFWRKWHITLGSWFREYVYIPLGGNRCGRLRTFLNLLIVWMLTGLWHGASLNFVLWGITLFCLIALERSGLKRWLDRWKILGHAYMLLCIPLTWAIFAVTDLRQLGELFCRLFPFLRPDYHPIFPTDFIKYGKTYGIPLVLGFVFSTRLPCRIFKKIKNSFWETVLLLAIFWTAVYLIYIGLNDPFLYFRF